MWGDLQMCKRRQEFSPRLVASLEQPRRSDTPVEVCGYEAWGYKSSSLKAGGDAGGFIEFKGLLTSLNNIPSNPTRALLSAVSVPESKSHHRLHLTVTVQDWLGAKTYIQPYISKKKKTTKKNP